MVSVLRIAFDLGLGFDLMNHDVAMGMSVWLMKSDTRITRQTAMPSSFKYTFISLGLLKMSGRNTITEVNVPVITAIETSAEPREVAVLGSSPSSWWRKMFSITTTALSTSMPMATMSPRSTSVFIDPPRAHTKPHATKIENGMHATETNVVDARRKKANNTTAAK